MLYPRLTLICTSFFNFINMDLIFYHLFSDILTWKNCFNSINTRMAGWQLLTYFIYLHNYVLHVLLSSINEQMFEKCNIHQIDSKNDYLLLSVSFTAKFGLAFVLTLENALSQRFHFKANKNKTASSKNGTRDSLNSPPFERSACFYVTISENFERF